ncbi:MAG: thiazole biosynthesis adenylyltransferase ThiF [Tepidisphaera sp.]|nr:thiazole biosynthesis adenylyltransferase ThiF [Tepidisphaera sp.]
MSLSRHHRQTLLPGIGDAGQAKLAASHAAIVGVGALGCASAELLCRAGVGTLTLIDRDVVDLTNLQRQVLFGVADVGMPKAEAATARLRAIDPGVRVIAHAADLTGANAERLLGLERGAPRARSASEGLRNVRIAAGTEDVDSPPSPPDIFIDGTDNFETRYLLNDLAVKHSLPLAYGGVIATRGMSGTFVPGGPCLRCVFEEPPEPGSQPTCDTAGVFGPVVAIVGATQAADAIKILCGQPHTLSRTLLNFDIWANERRRFPLGDSPRPDCPCCGSRRFEFLEHARGDSLSLCGQDAIQVSPGRDVTLDLESLRERLARVAASAPVATRFMVRARVQSGTGEVDISVFADGRAIIRGTTDANVARSVYAKYIGA